VLAVEASGSFVYAVVDDYLGGWGPITYVAGYSIDTPSGGLAPILNTPFFGNYFVTNNSNLSYDAIATSGNFLWVNTPAGISAFSIDSGTGVLTQVSGSPFAAGTASDGMAVASDGKFLYEASSGSNEIYVFTIDPTTGAVSSIGDPVAAASEPFILTLYKP
jgi:6-phosphogluconolactonase